MQCKEIVHECVGREKKILKYLEIFLARLFRIRDGNFLNVKYKRDKNGLFNYALVRW